MITNQGAYPEPKGEGKAYFRQIAIYDDKFLPQFERIAAMLSVWRGYGVDPIVLLNDINSWQDFLNRQKQVFSEIKEGGKIGIIPKNSVGTEGDIANPIVIMIFCITPSPAYILRRFNYLQMSDVFLQLTI